MRWAALVLIGTGNADHGNLDSFSSFSFFSFLLLFRFFLPTGDDTTIDSEYSIEQRME